MTADSPRPYGEVPGSGKQFADFVVALLLLGILASVLVRPERINPDAAQYVQCGQMILLGAEPFVDIYDTNPPLIMYLSAIPVLASQLVGLPVIPVFNLCVLGLLIWSTYSCRGLLSIPSAGLGAVPVRAALVAYVGASCFLLARLDYGQREHLVVLALTPFLCLRALRYLGGASPREVAWRGAALGAVAGIGLCLKPQFALVLLLVEGYQLLVRRRFAQWAGPELLGLLIPVTAYAAYLAWFLSPAAHGNMFGHVIPMALEGYAAYDAGFGRLVGSWMFLACGLVAVVPMAIRPVCPSRHWDLVRHFQIAVIGALLVYLQQGKGWGYHLVPAVTWSALVLGAVSSYLPLSFPSAAQQSGLVLRCRPGMAKGVLTVAVALGIASAAWLPGSPEVPADTAIGRVIARYSQPNDRVLVLSTGVANPPYPLLLQAERFQASRYLCAWPVPGFYQGTGPLPDGRFPYHTLTTAPPAERRFLRETEEDIERYRPPLILVRSGGHFQACPPGFNLLEYFQQSGFVARAMSDYFPRETVSDFTVYTVAGPPSAGAGNGTSPPE